MNDARRGDGGLPWVWAGHFPIPFPVVSECLALASE